MLPFRVTSCNLFDKSERFPRLVFLRGNLRRGAGRTAFALRYVRAFEFFLCPAFALRYVRAFEFFLCPVFLVRYVRRFALSFAGAFDGLRLTACVRRRRSVGRFAFCRFRQRRYWGVRLFFFFCPVSLKRLFRADYLYRVVCAVYVACIPYAVCFIYAIGAACAIYAVYVGRRVDGSASSLCSGERRRFPN